MNTDSWIAGLMRENYEAVGFIPQPTIAQRYIARQRYVLQHDECGHPVGYMLYGAIHAARPLSIAQHCIQHESRLRGYGEAALHELVERAERGGASSISVRCAESLGSLTFWQAQGFQARGVVPGGLKRGRTIVQLWLPLCLPLMARAPQGEERETR